MHPDRGNCNTNVCPRQLQHQCLPAVPQMRLAGRIHLCEQPRGTPRAPRETAGGRPQWRPTHTCNHPHTHPTTHRQTSTEQFACISDGGDGTEEIWEFYSGTAHWIHKSRQHPLMSHFRDNLPQRERERERERERQTDRPTDRPTDQPTGRPIDRPTGDARADRQADRSTDRPAGRPTADRPPKRGE